MVFDTNLLTWIKQRFSETTHTHGNLQADGQVGATAQANKNVVTDNNGKITTEEKVSAVDVVADGNMNAVTSNAVYDSVEGINTDLDDKEDVANKVTGISSSSTDTEYPSAKCVYDEFEEVNTLIGEAIDFING